MNNLAIEADRKAAFVSIYGNTSEIDDSHAGVNYRGFELVHFDPQTNYAQFKGRDYKPIVNYEYVEFARTVADGIPVRRRRLYTRQPFDAESSMRLESADLSYPLRDYEVSMHFRYPEQGGDQSRPYCMLEVSTNQTAGHVMLASSRYQASSGELPGRVDVTAGTVEQARLLQEQVATENRPYLRVPNNITIQGSEDGFKIWGPVEEKKPTREWGQLTEAKKTLIDEETGILVGIFPKAWHIKILRETKEGNNLELAVPHLDLDEINRKLRGDWKSFVTIPIENLVSFVHYSREDHSS